jgi:hypothetical protein
MKDDKRGAPKQTAPGAESLPNRILGSLRDALNAASRDDRTGEITMGEKTEPMPKTAAPDPQKAAASMRQPESAPTAVPPKSAAEAVREAKAPAREPVHFEPSEPTTKPAGAQPATMKAAAIPPTGEVRTQAVRGKPKVMRTAFHQDPVVGWLVVVGGPGLGAYRPVFEGNNAIGRSKNQRIPLDFGDETISSEEQAYLRYDSVDRSFLFVPNLSKTNIVSVNEKKPTGAVKLEVMDVIGIGRTQLAFVPFCGEEFDWSELAELKE